MERSRVLDSTSYCHLAQGGKVGGQLAAYFLLSLVVPSCNYSDRFNESDRIRTQKRLAANGGLQQPTKSTTWRLLLVPQQFYTAVVDYLVFD